MSAEIPSNVRQRSFRHIRVQPLSPALGAMIEGVDLRQPLSQAVVAEIRQAFLDHLVIFFPGPHLLSPVQQLTFTANFGEPMQYPQLNGLPECPQVTRVVKLEHERVNFGGLWHSDTTYLPRPPMARSLHAVEIPPRGGDTWFANQYLAFESLDEPLQQRLLGLRAVNSSAKAAVAKTREHRLRDEGREMKVFESTHPVVRTHPDTGRKALYVNVGHTVRLVGLPADESDELLEHLFAHQVSERFTFCYRWSVGSLALWDNRCTQHYAVPDYTERRVMHRVTVEGDKPY